MKWSANPRHIGRGFAFSWVYEQSVCMADKTNQLRRIRNEVVAIKTELAEQRRKGGYYPVIGEGNHDADIMFIGEAPGKNEAEQARPFCGPSGRVLDELLQSIGLAREAVYVSNIVKDRPPNNRDPSADEIEAYAPFLERQINIIQPRVVATLGRFSMEWMMRYFDVVAPVPAISKVHGQEFSFTAAYGEATLTPLFHPAVALYNASQKETLVQDFLVLKKYL